MSLMEGDTFSAWGKVSASSGYDWYATPYRCGDAVEIVSEEVRVKPQPPGWVGGSAKKFWKFEVNEVPRSSISCKILFRTDREWTEEDLEVNSGEGAIRTMNLQLSNPNLPPPGCFKWNDGCNTCDVMPDGGLTCTEMACLVQGEPYCVMWG